MVDESVTEPVEPTFEEQLAAARAYAMRSLARRESAESELARRLRQQGYQEEVRGGGRLLPRLQLGQ